MRLEYFSHVFLKIELERDEFVSCHNVWNIAVTPCWSTKTPPLIWINYPWKRNTMTCQNSRNAAEIFNSTRKMFRDEFRVMCIMYCVIRNFTVPKTKQRLNFSDDVCLFYGPSLKMASFALWLLCSLIITDGKCMRVKLFRSISFRSVFASSGAFAFD